MDEGDSITFTLSFNSGGRLAEFGPIPLSGTVTADDYTCGTPTSCGLLLRQGDTSNRDSLQLIYSITDDATAEPDETFTLAVPQATPIIGSGTYTTTSTDITVTIRANDGYVAPIAPGPAVDNPVARAERLEAPVAAVARGVGLLAMDAVTTRARSVATTNQFHLGQGATAEELLRRSSFNLAGGGAGDSGLNIWGGGDYIAAEGDHNGITYDGDTTAFHLGMDTTWRDGLIGIAAANSAGDLDFTANGMTSTLETNVTSIHPYLARRLNNSQLWTTIGYGSGEAELKEPGGANITTDLTVLTAAFNIAHAHNDTLSAQVGALYSRATMDEVAGPPGLSKVTVHTMRINAAGEVGWRHDNWRPFVTVSLRHDAGDGDVGSAGDLGGGVEWQTPTAILRLSGATHFAGDGAEEDRLTFTARQNAGRLNLGLNLGVANGMDTANLLSGELRF